MSTDTARAGIEKLRSVIATAGAELNGSIARGWIKEDLRQESLKNLRQCFDALNRALEKSARFNPTDPPPKV